MAKRKFVLFFLTPPGYTRTRVYFSTIFAAFAWIFSTAMFVTKLLNRTCYGLISTSLLQCWVNKRVPTCWQACYNLVGNNLATDLSQQPCAKKVNKLLQVCFNIMGQAVRTHPVDKMMAQTCNKSAAGLLQLVRFYACNRSITLRFKNTY